MEEHERSAGYANAEAAYPTVDRGGIRVILEIAGASASWADNKLHVAFRVIPEGHFHLDLKTGEIFQRSSYAVLRKQEDKAISATLFVGRQEHNAAGAKLPSEMRYFSERGEINLIWQLTDEHLAGFHSLVLAGRTPRTAVVFFQHGTLESGWEPDGSGQKWDNGKNPSVPIENVSFRFELHAQPTDEPLGKESADGDDRAFYSDAARVNFALLRRLTSIESSLTRLSWVVGLIALLMLGLALSRLWH